MHLSARPPLARILLIDTALRTNSWPNARTLGEKLEVHPRTIRRDIDYLRDQLHAPIAFDSKRNGYHYTEPTFRLPFLNLTEGELVALFLAEQILQQYRETPYGPDLARVFSKITAALNDPITVDARLLSESISFRVPAPALFDASILRTLIDATIHRRRVTIDYWTASRNTQSRRQVDPYHLTAIEGQFYMIGYCHSRRGVRTFVPARIRAIELRDESFTVPASFRIDDFLAGSLGVFGGDEGDPVCVRLRFTGMAARYVPERQWHRDQVIEKCQNGDVLLTVEVTHLREVERLVLTWSPYCEALDPPELRKRVATALKEAAEMHAKPIGTDNPRRTKR
jgi:predicted DNA-binding transcriptional regulator YafY